MKYLYILLFSGLALHPYSCNGMNINETEHLKAKKTCKPLVITEIKVEDLQQKDINQQVVKKLDNTQKVKKSCKMTPNTIIKLIEHYNKQDNEIAYKWLHILDLLFNIDCDIAGFELNHKINYNKRYIKLLGKLADKPIEKDTFKDLRTMIKEDQLADINSWNLIIENNNLQYRTIEELKKYRLSCLSNLEEKSLQKYQSIKCTKKFGGYTFVYE